ncbi:hypothetical protein DEA98_14645 [Brucella pseudogrignonensis]|nr:hypothetical protein [Brucella pseudogrignonensis]
MLSENIREMRREFQSALLDAGECVQISVLHMQSFVLALSMYEDAARDMEELIGPQSLPVRQQNSGGTILSFPLIRPSARSSSSSRAMAATWPDHSIHL